MEMINERVVLSLPNLTRIIRRIRSSIIIIAKKNLSKGKINISGRMTFDLGTRLESRENSIISVLGNVNVKRNCEFRAFNGGQLILHNGCSLNNNCFVAAGNKIEIGEGTTIAPNVVIVDHDHDYRHPDGLKALAYKTGEIFIGNNVWIGANAVILRNTYIGDNSVIGAGCIVSGHVESNTVLLQRRDTQLKKYNSALFEDKEGRV